MDGLFERLSRYERVPPAAIARTNIRAPHGWSGLAGLRVLVLEDSFLVAEVIAETLERQDCTVIGPVSRVHLARPIACHEALDGAMLDVNLAGELCFPVAEILARRRVPFLFLTGYSDVGMLPPRFRDATVVHKPFSPNELTDAAAALFGRAG